MEDKKLQDDKLERIIFKLIRIIGIIAIVGGFLEEEMINRYNTIVVGHIVFISPILIIEMVVAIVLYNLFIRFIEKHISITKKNI